MCDLILHVRFAYRAWWIAAGVLAQLDGELLSICQPPNTEKRDYTQSPSADLGTKVFWSQPAFTEGKGAGRSGGASRSRNVRGAA